MRAVGEAIDADIEGCPFGEFLVEIVAIVEGDDRAFVADRVAVKLRRLEIDAVAVRGPFEAALGRLDLRLADREGADIDATVGQCTVDFRQDLVGILDVFHDIERDDDVEGGVGKGLFLEVLVARALHDAAGGLVRIVLGGGVVRAFAGHQHRNAAAAGRGFMDAQAAPVGPDLVQHQRQRALARHRAAGTAGTPELIAMPGALVYACVQDFRSFPYDRNRQSSVRVVPRGVGNHEW